MENAKDIPGSGNDENFSELMEEYNLKSVDSDTPVEGRIIDIIDDGVIVDIGQKTEGILNKEELLDWEGNFSAKVGDAITVICKQVNTKEGYILVSKKNNPSELLQ